MANVVKPYGDMPTVSKAPIQDQGRDSLAQRMRRNSALPRRVALHVVLIALAFTMLFPFLWTVSASLKSNLNVIAVPPTLFPNPIHWDNYSTVFNTLPMFRGLLNSVIVAVSGTSLQVLTCSMAAYAFARIKFRFSGALFLVFLVTLMVPVQVTMVPLFMLMRILGLVNSYPGLILPGITSAFGVFLLRQFFLTIPRDLEEAAFLDGASHWTVFWRIVMPLSKPGLAALTIFAFMSYWNAFLWPLLITTDNNMATLPLMTSLLQNQYTTYWNQLMAGSVISIIPIMVVYLFAQRHFVQGMTLSGLKG